ncbi:MAG: NAD(P)H-dependent oxidoreductase subunit E [Elusimicrobiales bacterium]
MKKNSVVETLHRAQADKKSHTSLSADAMRDAARDCGAPPSQVYGVATFYTMFSVKPRGKHVIRICRNLACHMDGACKIVDALKKELGVELGGTTADGEFTLEESSCLGMCAAAPAMMIDDKQYGNLTAAGVKEILRRVRKGE